MQMYAIARFSKWLRDRQLDLHQVNEAAMRRFLKRDPGVVHSCESATLRRLLAMVQQIGVTVAKASEPGTCHQRFIVDYRRYLLRERGLAEATLVYFVRFSISPSRKRSWRRQLLSTQKEVAIGLTMTCWPSWKAY